MAHSRNDNGHRHNLARHLRSVADLARNFGACFGAADLAFYAGLWHDLGKFHPDFQTYLLQCEADHSARGSGPDHKGAGVVYASGCLQPLSLLIHGHHGGLRSMRETWRFATEQKSLATVQEALAAARQVMPDLAPASPVSLPGAMEADNLAAEMGLRLLFSALVDADYLDTEAHFQPGQAEARQGPTVEMAELWRRFERNQACLSGNPTSPVGRARQDIYRSAVAAAAQPAGVFRLTAPTGGGKTRAGMAFALQHALRHELRRIIVAVPFTSITEQTAQTYRDIFGRDDQGHQIVLEHHSQALANEDQEEDLALTQVRARLAAENWDAPIVVTTTVQLFDSLFSHATGRLRKIHRLTGSVILLDEVQSLPAPLLETIGDGLRQLAAWGGSTVVLSTATQPTLEAIRPLANLDAQEIVPNAGHWFAALRRVSYDWRLDEETTWVQLAQWMLSEKQVLAVVNLKRDAMALLDALGDEDALHLSTQMCGNHRRCVIEKVRDRLVAGNPCRLVSTQVIEAGVDLDFPVVFRALAPLDSIIQAAGRCNREGSLDRGRVTVFRPEGPGTPPGVYRTATQETRVTLGRGGDPEDPDTVAAYFQRLYRILDTDARGIQELRRDLDYPEVSRRFRMIDDDTTSVVVASYGSKQERHLVSETLEKMQYGAQGRAMLRVLQPYIVSLRTARVMELQRQSLVKFIGDNLALWCGVYHPVRGVTEAGLDPDDLVI